jgi:predicted transcriptional regulator
MTIQQMLCDLFAMGFSQQAIADRTETTQPTIHRASKGAGVRYETGKAIEALYEEALVSGSEVA